MNSAFFIMKYLCIFSFMCV